jgi:hypothetical protein
MFTVVHFFEPNTTYEVKKVKKVNCTPCTGTEALYRPYVPQEYR